MKGRYARLKHAVQNCCRRSRTRISPKRLWSTVLRRPFLLLIGTLIALLPLVTYPITDLKPYLLYPSSSGGTAQDVTSAMPQASTAETNDIINISVVGSEVPSIVMHCRSNAEELARFHSSMGRANLTAQVVHCDTSNRKAIVAAVLEGLLPQKALKASEGVSKRGRKRMMLLTAAVWHLRLMRSIVNSTSESKFYNILESTELVNVGFRTWREQLLSNLPRAVDFVNLNARSPAGDMLKLSKRIERSSPWMKGTVFKMKPGLSPFTNEHLSNYIVTKRAAGLILKLGRKYDTFGKWEAFDKFIFSHLNSKRGFLGFSVSAQTMSINCARTGDGGVLEKKRKAACSNSHKPLPYV